MHPLAALFIRFPFLLPTDEREGTNLFEGDIIISGSEQRELLGKFINQNRRGRQATEDDQSGSGQEPDLTEDRRWPGGRVPFKVDDASLG